MGVKDYFMLLRPLNCLIAGIASLIGFWIASGKILLNDYALLAFLAVFFVCGAGQAVNDYFDLEIDRKKKSKKPLVSGKVKPHDAFSFSMVLFLLGLVFAIFLGSLAFLIALFMSLLLTAYSAFPKLKFLGNWIVALGTAMTLLFGAAIAGNFGIVVWLFPAMLFANVARELIKDLEDLHADKGVKKTLPSMIGVKRSKYIIAAVYALAIIFSYYAFSFGIVKSYFYLLFVSMAAVIFLLSVRSVGKNNFSKAQSLAKLGMVFALLAYFAVLF